MRAFSAKKYHEPRVEGGSLVLASRDGKAEVRVFEVIKYITPDNKSKIYRPTEGIALAAAQSSE